ncbi:MAG: D-alanyl-D-alanine carboxypeptidase [Rhodobacteraceae bacterium]|nr:D-alanyl-D-alanine carboxypeptidase [Paracoccaceae bacterium]
MVVACLVVALPAVVRAAPFAAMVIDARTGEVLRSTNADTRLHPASLTKMMTLYIAFEAIKRGEITLDTMVTISANAAREPPSRLGLRAGQRIAMRHLIRAAALRSANDAATAIGEAIEGSEAAFARRMNRTAQALGMTRTTFRNMHGLTQDGHLSTARDMTTLGRRLLFDHPEYYNIFSRRTADAGIAQVANTNRRFLDSYAGADGIKTGFTLAAGYNLTASAERGNKRIIVTVFGGTSTAQRNARVTELMDAGFRAAPNRARTVAPPAPDYTVSQDEVLMSSAGTEAAPAGRTLRLVRAVSKSPRPPARPGAAPGPATEPLVAALEPAIASALAEATAAPPEVPQPDEATAAAADPAPADGAAAPAQVVALADDPALAQVRPPPRPDVPGTIASGTAVADAATGAVDVAEASAADAIAQALAEALAQPPDAAMAVADVPVADADAVANLEDGFVDMPVPADAPMASIELPARADAPDSGIFLAAVRPDALIPEAPETQVVTRLSTSGGRHWAVSLGRFNTRDSAERALLRAALAEIGTLDTADRRVRQTGGAWEATFQGLHEVAAGTACQRLALRGTDCTPVAPGS